MKRTKKQNQRIHFKNRFLERFDRSVNRQDLRNIVTLIQTNKAKFLEKRSCRFSLFEVNYLDIQFKVVYDRSRANVVTAIPFD